ncbi:hypothetical protein BDZ90DRAFT_229902 [Jaminaea rosea]|uniref:Uncharacterized protein n=1 Tax=Jaminaea rosea TaxID=1569628 RepID=A0A316V2Z8_9BASI|nr:hypothetical protein BDZ90DRAFT_229902 [Jaminaea rosea]PWN30911.1 hypothetical protein BDZ90DRAFT_229902 [Jaminaea rosea]
MSARDAASALLPNSISSALTRPHATTDSRLLQNLIKTEKSYTNHLSSTVTSSRAAAAALKAWGTSEARDVAQTSSLISDLLSEVADAQNNHLEAIRGYREALKDIADREASIRTIVRDRDILVSRLIKASKKNGDVAHAQRELTACEEVLEAEERALIGVKRRTFKEALSMRMKMMGDAGSRMIESAKEAILLLDDFDQHAGHDYDGAGYDQEYAQGNEYGQGGYDAQYDQQQQGQGYGDYQQEHYYGPMHQQYDEGQGMQQGYDFAGQGQQQMPISHEQSNFENASVTPSQSASQAAQGGRYAGKAAEEQSYQQPAFAAGHPHESEERGDSDASSEADVEQAGIQRHENQRPGLQSQNSQPAPTPPAKEHNQANYGLGQQNGRPPREEPPASAPQPAYSQPQMYSATAPRFNYDGAQLAPIPQAPRLYNRGEDNDSSSDEDTRPTTAHQGWSSRPTRGQDDDNSSDEGGRRGGAGGGRPSATPARPGHQKRNSFLGKVSKLFKTDMKEATSGEQHQQQHSRQGSGSNHRRSESADGASAWQTRTDRNVKTAQKDNTKALGLQPRSSLLRPLDAGADNDSSSDDEERRTDLVKVTNTGRGRTQSSVGGSLRRTPSELARITAGPMSTRQRNEAEAKREQEELERKTREAVFGTGVGSGSATLPRTLSRTNSTRSAAAPTPKKKKKKTPSVAGSEVGTSATRQAGSAGPAPPAKTGTYVVHGDQSAGHRGLASLVLPSDIAKGGDANKPYPSIMPPSGLPPAAVSLSRSNSVSTVGRASTIGRASTASKKKKRTSAISDSPGTGLVGMSPRDQGKYTTNSWVPQPQGGQGLAAQAVASLGVTPHKPASGAEIAQKQTAATSGDATGTAQRPVSTLAAPSPAAPAMRPSSSQQSTPLKSALKHPNRPTSPSPAGAGAAPVLDINASLGPIVSAPPRVSAIMAEQEQPSIMPPVPQAPEMKQPSLSVDKNFDGSGRLDMGRSSSAEGLASGESQQQQPSTPARERVALPQLDMPASEPFNVNWRRDSATTPASTKGTPAHAVAKGQSEEILLTPGEQNAYRSLMQSHGGESPEATRNGGKDAQGRDNEAFATEKDPEGVTRIMANRVRVGGGSERAQSPSPAVAPQPSRTYSSEGRTLHTSRSSAAASPAPAAPPHLASALAAPASDVSAAGSATDGVSRRKSVRLAPDTKLPPETPPATAMASGGSTRAPDGFGGFKLESISAPGSSLVSSGNAPNDSSAQQNQDKPKSYEPLSSRIAPPPTAPPRLPNKEREPNAFNTQLVQPEQRERSGWSTRIDRRLANDDSSDEEGGAAQGGAGAGEGIDAYASARRAMGVAQRHWSEATSPVSKKKKSKSGGETGSVRSKSSKRRSGVSDTGYNPAIPLPKGMEVVARGKGSAR